MLDIASLLAPTAGLVDEFSVSSPSPENYGYWRAVARLACRHDESAPDTGAIAPCTTGACAVSRAGAVIRMAGESVERMALHPTEGVRATVTQLGEEALRYWGEAGLADPPGARRLEWYPAAHLATGARRMAPAHLVNFPVDHPEPGFDPGPSGTAAALDAGDALYRALLETVERDAVIVAWARQQRLLAVDIERAMKEADWDREWQTLKEVLDAAERFGHEPVFARIPLGVEGLFCVVGGVRYAGAHHRLVSLGAKVSAHPAVALSAALQESIQLLGALRINEKPGFHTATVAGESDRVDFLASASGHEAIEEWLADPVPSSLPAGPTGKAYDVDELLGLLRADGLDPYVVDLTARLPPRVRELGWTVTKVIPVGYQPLRIDERTTYGWHGHRLATVEQRTGVAARRPVTSLSPDPHPLP